MVDSFYLEINLELFYKWIINNKNKYDADITCTAKINDNYHSVYFNYHQTNGCIVIWSSGIIEEQILDNDNNVLFYLHFKLIDLAQSQKYFYEFYEELIKHSQLPPTKIILCCSGGLSSSFFADKLTKLIELKHLNYQIIAIGFHQLCDDYSNCEALYLAPQISYLAPQAMNIVHIPVYCISPSIYATYNYRALLDLITKNSKSEA